MRKYLLVLILTAALPWTGWAAMNDPSTVVQSAVDGVIDVLKSRQYQDRLTEADRNAIRQAVAGYFDFRQMAKLSLGKNWKKLDEKQRDTFVSTFQELLERSYGNRLAQYRNQQVTYGEVKTRDDRAVVDSEVVSSEQTIPVSYSLYMSESGWRVYDIKIEGVSMVSTFRADFKSIVEQQGVGGLLQTLGDKVKHLKEDEKSQG